MSRPQFAQVVAVADSTDAALRLVDTDANGEEKLDGNQAHHHNGDFHFSPRKNTRTAPSQVPHQTHQQSKEDTHRRHNRQRRTRREITVATSNKL
jgi:hypothetical protein